ncbi:Vitelline membrane outer layer protein 1-like protein [Armadillidium nasatum]|uniref:Vitelline membrane outer layer protein 1-like protein n=1 Tax=Armadillidium nasatum TaxID=96803 RepID=A0A5N5SWY6_9CRUS|nr:Vitelline membrane outer layer protein 1-like protein [Armadillidium nasatum]
MKAFTSCLFLTLLSLALCKSQIYDPPLKIYGQTITQTLYIDNAYHDSGVWGPISLCPNNSFVDAFELKYQEPGNVDETAINAIRLYCILNGHDTGYVESSTGTHGEYFGMRVCSGDYLLTGFRANTLEYQGTFTDDVAVENFEGSCGYGREIVSGGIPSLSLQSRRDVSLQNVI